MSNVKYVDIEKTLDSLDLDKAVELFEFHKYLKTKKYWTLSKQILLIKKITKRIKEAIRYENLLKLTFLSAVLEMHLKFGMLDMDQLVDAKFNPLTHFLVDCEKSKIHEEPLAGQYIDLLLSIGDDRINKKVFHEIEDVCQSRYVNIGIDRERESL